MWYKCWKYKLFYISIFKKEKLNLDLMYKSVFFLEIIHVALLDIIIFLGSKIWW